MFARNVSIGPHSLRHTYRTITRKKPTSSARSKERYVTMVKYLSKTSEEITLNMLSDYQITKNLIPKETANQ